MFQSVWPSPFYDKPQSNTSFLLLLQHNKAKYVLWDFQFTLDYQKYGKGLQQVILFFYVAKNLSLVSSKTNGIHNFVERDLAVIAICQIEVASPLFHLLQRINMNLCIISKRRENSKDFIDRNAVTMQSYFPSYILIKTLIVIRQIFKIFKL